MMAMWTIEGGTQGHREPLRYLEHHNWEAQQAIEAAGVDRLPGRWADSLHIRTRWAERRDGAGVRRPDHTAVRTDVAPVAMHEGAPDFVATMEAIGRVLGQLPGAYEVGVCQGIHHPTALSKSFRPTAYVVRRLGQEG